MKAMYEALREAYPFPDDHRIFLREWGPDSVSQNGLLGSEQAKPVFLIHAPNGAREAIAEKDRYSQRSRQFQRRVGSAAFDTLQLLRLTIRSEEY